MTYSDQIIETSTTKYVILVNATKAKIECNGFTDLKVTLVKLFGTFEKSAVMARCSILTA